MGTSIGSLLGTSSGRRVECHKFNSQGPGLSFLRFNVVDLECQSVGSQGPVS